MFDRHLKQKLVINKADGSKITDIKASVQEIIYVGDITVPIEEGDIVEYVMPSGVLQKLLITKVTLYNMGSSLDHYELEFQKA